MNLLTDLITYFAKFPAKEGVLNNFASKTDKFTGYSAFKATIEALPDPLLPEIEDLVFSTSEIALSNKLRNTNGFFMLIEYGTLSTGAANTAGGRDSNISLSLTIGHPYRETNTDAMEETLIMDKCLDLLTSIIDQMDEDNPDICNLKQFLPDSYTISPAEPALLYNNLGWTLNFKKNETR
jgi:hypothetical protein